MIGLDVYREGDCLRLKGERQRYDSIKTLVMHSATVASYISTGDHNVLACFRYPVHSSKYYK